MRPLKVCAPIMAIAAIGAVHAAPPPGSSPNGASSITTTPSPAAKTTLDRRVVKIVSEQLGVPAAKVTRASHFMRDLGADSLDLVELCMAAEDEFQIEIPDADALRIQTVGAAIDYLQRKVGQPELAARKTG